MMHLVFLYLSCGLYAENAGWIQAKLHSKYLYPFYVHNTYYTHSKSKTSIGKHIKAWSRSNYSVFQFIFICMRFFYSWRACEYTGTHSSLQAVEANYTYRNTHLSYHPCPTSTLSKHSCLLNDKRGRRCSWFKKSLSTIWVKVMSVE
jgi:hypothetical protein